jgi:hypothetical protein
MLAHVFRSVKKSSDLCGFVKFLSWSCVGELRCSYSLSLEILTVMLVAGADEAAMEHSGVLSSEVCNGVCLRSHVVHSFEFRDYAKANYSARFLLQLFRAFAFELLVGCAGSSGLGYTNALTIA